MVVVGLGLCSSRRLGVSNDLNDGSIFDGAKWDWKINHTRQKVFLQINKSKEKCDTRLNMSPQGILDNMSLLLRIRPLHLRRLIIATSPFPSLVWPTSPIATGVVPTIETGISVFDVSASRPGWFAWSIRHVLIFVRGLVLLVLRRLRGDSRGGGDGVGGVVASCRGEVKEWNGDGGCFGSRCWINWKWAFDSICVDWIQKSIRGTASGWTNFNRVRSRHNTS